MSNESYLDDLGRFNDEEQAELEEMKAEQAVQELLHDQMIERAEATFNRYPSMKAENVWRNALGRKYKRQNKKRLPRWYSLDYVPYSQLARSWPLQ